MAENAASSAARLYTPEILHLATELAKFPLSNSYGHRASVRSRSCGSTLEIGLELEGQGRIAEIGLAVSACVIGQASAAIFASNAVSKSGAEVAEVGNSLANWLADDGEMPDWPKIEQLTAAKAYSGRHEAIMLPWRAAIEALSKVSQSG